MPPLARWWAPIPCSGWCCRSRRWLMARLGDRPDVLAGLGLLVLGGALLAAAPGFGVALAGRLVSGAGAVLLLVALPTIVAGNFIRRCAFCRDGDPLAGYPLGIGLGSLLLPLAGSWRVAMAWTAALASAAVIAATIALPRSPGSAAWARRAPARHQGGGRGDRRRPGLGMLQCGLRGAARLRPGLLRGPGRVGPSRWRARQPDSPSRRCRSDRSADGCWAACHGRFWASPAASPSPRSPRLALTLEIAPRPCWWQLGWRWARPQARSWPCRRQCSRRSIARWGWGCSGQSSSPR